MASAAMAASAQLHASCAAAAFLNAVGRLSESDRSWRRIKLASVDDGLLLMMTCRGCAMQDSTGSCVCGRRARCKDRRGYCRVNT